MSQSSCEVLLMSSVAISAWNSHYLTEEFKLAQHEQYRSVAEPLHRVCFLMDENDHGSVWAQHLVLQVSLIREILLMELLPDPPRKPPLAFPPSLQ